MDMIRTIEEISMNAWPALQTVFLDGWVLRFANGYTRRANSINPLYLPSEDLVAAIGRCEQLYQQRGLPVVFKLTPAAQPAQLDEVLALRGYAEEAHTSVQTADLAAALATPTQIAQLADQPSDAWLTAFCQLSQIDQRHLSTMGQMLHNLAPAACFAALRQDGKIATCGLGIRQENFIGLFDIVTDPQLRRRGYGRQLVLNLLAWGKRQGAQSAYLQVMLDNDPALRLYARLGFKEAYRYWYRVSRQPHPS